jgi:type I restriction enzyme, S subunit
MVPGNWKYSSLKDAIAKVIGGGTPPRAIARYWKGSIPWASVKDFQDDMLLLYDTQEHISREGLIKSAANEIAPNTLVICTRMAIGRAAIVEFPTAINQDLKALYPKSHLQTKFLLYFLHQNRQMLETLSIGSTVKGITTNQLLSLTIGIPPTDEQCCITHILDTLNTQIQQTEQLIAKLKQIKIGLLHDLLTRGIDSHGNVRDPMAHPEEFKEKYFLQKRHYSGTFFNLNSNPLKR